MTPPPERASQPNRRGHKHHQGLYPAGPAQEADTNQEKVNVVPPDQPPALPPQAARALLRILRKAYAQRTAREKQAPPSEEEGGT